MQLRSFRQIHLAIQESFQFLPKSDHLQQGTALLQIHQKVKVAAGPILGGRWWARCPPATAPTA